MTRPARAAPLGTVVAAAALITWLYPHPPDRFDPGLAWSSPSWSRPFGCGDLGVDLLSVVAHAVLSGVLLAVLVASFGLLLGTLAGALAALARGRLERFVVRACDLTQAFPTFLLALAVLSAVRSPTRVHLFFVFASTAWAPFARLALAETRVLREAAFIEAAFALGLPRARVVLRHILPNLVGVVAVQLGSAGAAVVVAEAAFAFVGMGPHDGVSLGNVLDQGVVSMLRAPHVLWVGATAVFVTSAAMLVAGAALASDARERKAPR